MLNGKSGEVETYTISDFGIDCGEYRHDKINGAEPIHFRSYLMFFEFVFHWFRTVYTGVKRDISNLFTYSAIALTPSIDFIEHVKKIAQRVSILQITNYIFFKLEFYNWVFGRTLIDSQSRKTHLTEKSVSKSEFV